MKDLELADEITSALKTSVIPAICERGEAQTPLQSHLVRLRIRCKTECAWLLVVLALWALPAASPVHADDFTYTTNNGTITITGYTGPGGDVTIPSVVNGLPVTTIGRAAFRFGSSLTRVTIPDSVTTIEDSAFGYCFSLTNVIMGNSVTTIGAGAFSYCTSLIGVSVGKSVTTIGDHAFSYCTSLTGITFPNSVSIIELYAFYRCTGLTNVIIPDRVITLGTYAFGHCLHLSAIEVNAGNSVYSSIDGVLFDKNQTTLIQCPGGKSGNYTIPDSVSIVGESAFYWCTNLSSLTIPKGVTNIKSSAFSWCVNLTNVMIPDGVIAIGAYAFSFCTRLSAIEVGALNSVYSSIDGVLFNKSQTLLIQYPGGKGGSYTIPDTVITIGESAFYWCTNLDSVTIPNSVSTIGNWAFESCSRLAKVEIGDGVTIIGKSTFNDCESLAVITIPSSVTTIGAYGFSSCTSLTGVYFRGHSPVVGTSVFSGANDVTAYYLPGTTGWGPTFGERPTALWRLPYPVILDFGPSFGVQTNRFGFIISWATNASVVVEGSSDLAAPTWSPVATNTITLGTDPLTDGWSYFSDPELAEHPTRIYRIRSP